MSRSIPDSRLGHPPGSLLIISIAKPSAPTVRVNDAAALGKPGSMISGHPEPQELCDEYFHSGLGLARRQPDPVLKPNQPSNPRVHNSAIAADADPDLIGLAGSRSPVEGKPIWDWV